MNQEILKRNRTYRQILETFDLLFNDEKLEDFLISLTDNQRSKLYNHKLLKIYDLLP